MEIVAYTPGVRVRCAYLTAPPHKLVWILLALAVSSSLAVLIGLYLGVLVTLVKVGFDISLMSFSIVVDMLDRVEDVYAGMKPREGVEFIRNYVTLIIVLKYGSCRMTIEVKNMLHNL